MSAYFKISCKPRQTLAVPHSEISRIPAVGSRYGLNSHEGAYEETKIAFGESGRKRVRKSSWEGGKDSLEEKDDINCTEVILA